MRMTLLLLGLTRSQLFLTADVSVLSTVYVS